MNPTWKHGVPNPGFLVPPQMDALMAPTHSHSQGAECAFLLPLARWGRHSGSARGLQLEATWGVGRGGRGSLGDTLIRGGW